MTTTTIDVAPVRVRANRSKKYITASKICECKTCKEEAKLTLTIHCCVEHAKKIIQAIEEIEEMEEGFNIAGWDE